MKKIVYLFCLLLTFYSQFSTAQLTCIYCYDQNDTISGTITNLITNGGFEINSCTADSESYSFCPNSYSYACGIQDWTCTGGGIYTYACVIDSLWSVIPEGIRAVYFGNNEGKMCSSTIGDTSCIVNTSCTVTGFPPGYPKSDDTYYGGINGVSLQQTVYGLTVGNNYVLEFWAGGEYHFIGTVNFPDNSIFAVDIGFGNTFLKQKPTAPVTGIGTRYIIEFIAVATSQTIKFTNWGHMCQTCSELVIDDVRLYTLAEVSPAVPVCNSGLSGEPTLQISLDLSPNPVINELYIKTNGNELSDIIILDIIGKVVYSSNRKIPGENNKTIDLNVLAKGIYFLDVDVDGNRIVKKIVKE